MSFPTAPTFPGRFKRPVSSTFPTAPTWPPSSVLPTPPVPGPSLWLRGDDAPNSSGIGLAVPLWKDVSGNGNDATQSVAASQPTGISNQINGHAAVVFDGVNDDMLIALTTSQLLASGFTYLAVIELTDLNNAYMLYGASKSNGIDFRINGTTGKQNLDASAAANEGSSSSGITSGKFWVISFTCSSAIALSFFNNGVSAGTAAGALSDFTSGLDATAILGNTWYGQPLLGKIAEKLIYPALSDSDRQTVQAYLGTKYAIPVSLPQITQVDFTGLSGASFVTGGAGLSYLQYIGTQPQGIWFNTGAETQPDLSGSGVGNYVSIAVNPLGNSDSVAEDLKNGINGSGTGNWTAVHNSFTGQCQITDIVNRVDTPAIDVNTGAAITVLQAGHPNE